MNLTLCFHLVAQGRHMGIVLTFLCPSFPICNSDFDHPLNCLYHFISIVNTLVEATIPFKQNYGNSNSLYASKIAASIRSLHSGQCDQGTSENVLSEFEVLQWIPLKINSRFMRTFKIYPLLSSLDFHPFRCHAQLSFQA